MQKQAVPVLQAEAPLVATGTEGLVLANNSRIVRSEIAGTVSYLDGRKIEVSDDKGKKVSYELDNFIRTNSSTNHHQRPVIELGQKVKKGDLLADTSSSDYGQIALGKNLLVAFMSWSGNNYEDAIIISQRLVKDSTLTSIHMEEVVVNVRDTKLGPEQTTPDIPNVSENKLKNLDAEGLSELEQK